MFCKLDVRHKSIVTLALLKDCCRIFCKSGPRITSMHWTQSAVSFLVTLVSLTKQLNWLRRCMGCGLKWDQETMYWVGAWTPRKRGNSVGDISQCHVSIANIWHAVSNLFGSWQQWWCGLSPWILQQIIFTSWYMQQPGNYPPQDGTAWTHFHQESKTDTTTVLTPLTFTRFHSMSRLL